MYQTDFEQFGALMRQLSQVFAKKLTDEMVQAYWAALKDQSFPTVKRFADQHIRYQKFFPKPFELREKEEKSVARDAKADADFKAAEDRCIRNLEELRTLDPIAHRREVGRRVVNRVLATQHPGSSMYEAALNEWRSNHE
jgi:hypothetical protein